MDTSPHVSPRALNHINSDHAAQAPQNAPAEYERLLADFPQSLHAVLRTSFPTILQLQSFRQDLAANGGTPGQAGYGLMAWLVLHRGWFQWLGIDAPE